MATATLVRPSGTGALTRPGGSAVLNGDGWPMVTMAPCVVSLESTGSAVSVDAGVLLTEAACLVSLESTSSALVTTTATAAATPSLESTASTLVVTATTAAATPSLESDASTLVTSTTTAASAPSLESTATASVAAAVTGYALDTYFLTDGAAYWEDPELTVMFNTYGSFSIIYRAQLPGTSTNGYPWGVCDLSSPSTVRNYASFRRTVTTWQFAQVKATVVQHRWDTTMGSEVNEKGAVTLALDSTADPVGHIDNVLAAAGAGSTSGVYPIIPDAAYDYGAIGQRRGSSSYDVSGSGFKIWEFAVCPVLTSGQRAAIAAATDDSVPLKTLAGGTLYMHRVFDEAYDSGAGVMKCPDREGGADATLINGDSANLVSGSYW